MLNNSRSRGMGFAAANAKGNADTGRCLMRIFGARCVRHFFCARCKKSIAEAFLRFSGLLNDLEDGLVLATNLIWYSISSSVHSMSFHGKGEMQLQVGLSMSQQMVCRFESTIADALNVLSVPSAQK